MYKPKITRWRYGHSIKSHPDIVFLLLWRRFWKTCVTSSTFLCSMPKRGKHHESLIWDQEHKLYSPFNTQFIKLYILVFTALSIIKLQKQYSSICLETIKIVDKTVLDLLTLAFQHIAIYLTFMLRWRKVLTAFLHIIASKCHMGGH